MQEHLFPGDIRYSGHVSADGGAIFGTHFVRNTTRRVVGLTEGQKLNNGLNSDIGVKSVIPTCR